MLFSTTQCTRHVTLHPVVCLGGSYLCVHDDVHATHVVACGAWRKIFSLAFHLPPCCSHTQRARHAPLHPVVHLDGYYLRVHDGMRRTHVLVRGARMKIISHYISLPPHCSHMHSMHRDLHFTWQCVWGMCYPYVHDTLHRTSRMQEDGDFIFSSPTCCSWGKLLLHCSTNTKHSREGHLRKRGGGGRVSTGIHI